MSSFTEKCAKVCVFWYCFVSATATFAGDATEFAGTYFCTGDAVGGVRYDETTGDWVGDRFAAGEKYILNIRNNNEIFDEFYDEMRMAYFIEFSEHGTVSEKLSCYTHSDLLRSIDPLASFISDSGYFSCSLIGGDLIVDLGTLRFFTKLHLGIC